MANYNVYVFGSKGVNYASFYSIPVNDGFEVLSYKKSPLRRKKLDNTEKMSYLGQTFVNRQEALIIQRIEYVVKLQTTVTVFDITGGRAWGDP